MTGFMYTSMFFPCGEYFPKMSKMGMTKKCFMVIQGDKLYINTNIGQVDHWHRNDGDGLNPSLNNVMRMFGNPLLNEENLVSTA